jgi:hypothetical protein
LFNMEEAARYSMAFGLGAELGRIGGCQTCLDAPAGSTGFSPRVSLNLARNNIWGLGHTLSLQTRASTLEQRALLSYNWPRFRAQDHLNLSFNALYQDSRDVRTFSFKREEGSIQLSQRLSKAMTVFYRFTYRRVSVSDLKISPFLINLLSQPVRLGLASFGWIQDRRDDPVEPHKGIYNTVDVGLAEHFLGSQLDFVRFLVRNATYHPLGKRVVLSRSTQIGDIASFHYQGDPLNAVPLPERFFGGGAQSDRGFPENQAGPRDPSTGFPLGGTALFFNQTELRFPLIGGVSRCGERLLEFEQDLPAADPARFAGLRLHGARRRHRRPLPHAGRSAAPGLGVQHQSAPVLRFQGDAAGPAQRRRQSVPELWKVCAAERQPLSILLFDRPDILRTGF